MLSNFEHILPEVIFEAVESLGGRCTGRFLALNAMENRVYQVDKEDEDSVVIKFYRPGRWDEKTILTEHFFLEKLLENEVPVVCPIKNNEQKSLFKIKDVFFSVFPKKAGRLEPELNTEQLQRLGRFLARIHNVGTSLKKMPRMELSTETYGLSCLNYLEEKSLVPGYFKEKYFSLVKNCCGLIEPRMKDHERILLHGDCHVGNVLWKNSEPYFIDFDDMLYAPPVQDIWMLTGADDEYGKKMRETLLEAYEEIRTFDYTSLNLIESLRTLRMIYFATWIAKRWEDGAFKLAFPYFGTEKFWQEQIEGLAVQREKLS